MVCAMLRRLAVRVDQVQQRGGPLCQAVWAKLGRNRRLGERLRAVFSADVLASMRPRCEALLYGLKKTAPIFAVDASSSPLMCRSATA